MSDNNILNTTAEKTNVASLSDDELDGVVGGLGAEAPKTVIAYCPGCKKNSEFEIFSGTRGRCKKCHTPLSGI